ncbi:MAG: DNA glycosylase AlkZ-like family protein, partial [Betaproteobacteria bacterium]
EHFWGWAYRFEAYTPAAKRERGYYAMPLLWRGQVIGWGNVSVKAEAAGGCSGLRAEFGYVAGRAPRDAAFKAALAEEVQRLQVFLERP